MNIIDKIENSEILGHLTFLIDEVEKDINETEKNISLMHKKYIKTEIIIKIRLNDKFSILSKAINNSALKLNDFSNAMERLSKVANDSAPKLSNISNNMRKISQSICSSFAASSYVNNFPIFKEAVKMEMKRQEQEARECLMN